MPDNFPLQFVLDRFLFFRRVRLICAGATVAVEGLLTRLQKQSLPPCKRYGAPADSWGFMHRILHSGGLATTVSEPCNHVRASFSACRSWRSTRGSSGRTCFTVALPDVLCTSAASAEATRSDARPISPQWRGENILSLDLHQSDQEDLLPTLSFLYLAPGAGKMHNFNRLTYHNGVSMPLTSVSRCSKPASRQHSEMVSGG